MICPYLGYLKITAVTWRIFTTEHTEITERIYIFFLCGDNFPSAPSEKLADHIMYFIRLRVKITMPLAGQHDEF